MKTECEITSTYDKPMRVAGKMLGVDMSKAGVDVLEGMAQHQYGISFINLMIVLHLLPTLHIGKSGFSDDIFIGFADLYSQKWILKADILNIGRGTVHMNDDEISLLTIRLLDYGEESGTASGYDFIESCLISRYNIDNRKLKRILIDLFKEVREASMCFVENIRRSQDPKEIRSTARKIIHKLIDL